MSDTVVSPTPGRSPLVLVVDEIPSVIRLLQLELAVQGFDVAAAEVGEDTYRAMEEHRPDAVLLEVLLPGLSGFEVLRTLKERYPQTPVIFLTSQDNPADQAYGFELGADDYIMKPFDAADLGLRLNAVLGRSLPDLNRHVVAVGDLTIDLIRKVVRRGSQIIGLTTNEWALLHALALEPRSAHVAADLLSAIWGAEYVDEVRYLELWIELLRRKLEIDPSQPQVILGDSDEGYRLASD
jgi:DNA-binding response OmpR family regulator